MDSKSAKWIAQETIRELTSEKVQERQKNNRGANLTTRILPLGCIAAFAKIKFLISQAKFISSDLRKSEES